jgi:hypothetical protein
MHLCMCTYVLAPLSRPCMPCDSLRHARLHGLNTRSYVCLDPRSEVCIPQDMIHLVKDFLLTVKSYPGNVPKRDRVWLASCRQAVTDHSGLSPAKLRHGRSSAVQKLPNRCLLRSRGRQGKYKCPLLRELLYDWFVDVRASVATRISPKFMLQKARHFADMIV